ncbi:hypothetical protein DFP72DRAFT_864974 [Ephemerocybe angulata]|uniref:Uncharacterized protein n=1 Tax=Ephemerocybe angulata TaxID=980116 RepID=A0A8H6MH72_9AGAR|nr:hypothetical protein DFP72DRAFT_864974 [Tulosesus angulatus]
MPANARILAHRLLHLLLPSSHPMFLDFRGLVVSGEGTDEHRRPSLKRAEAPKQVNRACTATSGKLDLQNTGCLN